MPSSASRFESTQRLATSNIRAPSPSRPRPLTKSLYCRQLHSSPTPSSKTFRFLPTCCRNCDPRHFSHLPIHCRLFEITTKGCSYRVREIILRQLSVSRLPFRQTLLSHWLIPGWGRPIAISGTTTKLSNTP